MWLNKSWGVIELETMKSGVIIIGGGIAGLSCARQLADKGLDFLVLESSDQVGGRMRTDIVEGFRLDRGFQVFLTRYPEARRILDLPALSLRPFVPGAMIRFDGRFHTISDPWRRPLGALASLLNPIGSIADKLRVAAVRSRVLRGRLEDLFEEPETTTLEALRNAGFSSSMIERFFRPFLGGIFLERDLETSSRMFSFVFRMFSSGDACLPAHGIQAIPDQVASALPPERIRTGVRVASITDGFVTLEDGERIEAAATVVATDAPTAAKLLGEDLPSAGTGVTCLYFAARSAPIKAPILVLNGDGTGPINNLCFPTRVAPGYGPGGSELVSVAVLGADKEEKDLLGSVSEQLHEWFGQEVDGWRHLRTYRIPYALPSQIPPALSVPEREVRVRPGVFICGDHRDNASIQGAMVSGRRAADAVAEFLM